MLHGISRSVEVADYTFPNRKDYFESLGISDSNELDKETSIAIQRDWHSRGQNGCVFAMFAAQKLNEEQWAYEAYDALPDAASMQDAIKSAVNDPDNEVLSLLFPTITDTPGLHSLIDLAIEAGCALQQEDLEGTQVLRLRWHLGDVESWVLGFIDNESMPATRRAPFTELVFRTKQKTKVIHRRLNNDPTQAHVADIDLGFDEAVLERLMDKSSQRTTRLLGGKAARDASHGAKAKTTYGIAKVLKIGTIE